MRRGICHEFWRVDIESGWAIALLPYITMMFRFLLDVVERFGSQLCYFSISFCFALIRLKASIFSGGISSKSHRNLHEMAQTSEVPSENNVRSKLLVHNFAQLESRPQSRDLRCGTRPTSPTKISYRTQTSTGHELFSKTCPAHEPSLLQYPYHPSMILQASVFIGPRSRLLLQFRSCASPHPTSCPSESSSATSRLGPSPSQHRPTH
jgi:hypothetical protein